MENFYSPIIKLPKSLIREEKEFKDKKLLMLCYLFFKTDCEHNICTTLNNICEKINLSTTSRNNKNNQYYIKETIRDLIDEGIIECLNYKNISEVTNDKLIELKFKEYEKYVNISSQYVILSIEEFNKILNCKKETSKLLNLYCKIKSYVCMDENCLKICYPSIKKMCYDFNCSRNTLKPILNILQENNLIYIYRFGENELNIRSYEKIEYIFALEKYTSKQIKQQFVLGLN